LIPHSFLQDLLNRVDVVEVVGRYVQLKKGGANFMGLCPFHNEKSPSFSVSPTKQFYHCFGCGAHGTAINFLMEHTGLTFPEAVNELAQGAGLTVPQEPRIGGEARDGASWKQTTGLVDLMKTACDFYMQALRGAPQAIDYLKKRGVTGKIALRFGLGYAASGWQNLETAFDDYRSDALVEVGLVLVSDKTDEAGAARRYDRFRDRVMFPIRNVRGQVIGFGGRVLDGGEPKYLNSPETPLFSKGSELYGLFEARLAIREKGYVLVVEGYMDVVALAQLGFPNAVATLGTACTPVHVQKLMRQTDMVVFSFDGDKAGRRAARRALDACLMQRTIARSSSCFCRLSTIRTVLCANMAPRRSPMKSSEPCRCRSSCSTRSWPTSRSTSPRAAPRPCSRPSRCSAPCRRTHSGPRWSICWRTGWACRLAKWRRSAGSTTRSSAPCTMRRRGPRGAA
jgi:DNA primase